MGDIAEGLLDGEFDYLTGEYIGESTGFPRTNLQKERKLQLKLETPSERKIRAVRRELSVLIKKKQAENDPQPVNNARKEINLKYGKGWRERGLSNNDNQWSEEELCKFKKQKG